MDHLSLALGYQFIDKKNLAMALTHKSAARESGGELDYNNERLEFLGDAVLSLVCANFLYQQKPFYREGILSGLRAQFVCRHNLSLGAKRIELGNYLISDKAMRSSGSNKSPAVLADALEAVFGAVFIDGGLDAAQQVIFNVLGEPSLELIIIHRDAKTRLQEIIQSRHRQAPKYVVLEKNGPAHAPTFIVGVKVNDELVASASGGNKKIAAQRAAASALSALSAT